jgi:hypothetical protein
MDQHGGAGESLGDGVLHLVGDLVRALERDPGGELEVQVDLVGAADVSRAEIVIADHRVDPVRARELEPVMTPAASLTVIRQLFEAIATIAARVLADALSFIE